MEKVDFIFVRSVNWLGDAVMTIPALRVLRARFPKAKIVLICPKKLSGLWSGQSFINDTVELLPGCSIFEHIRTIRGYIREHVGKNGNIAYLVLPNSPRTAIEACLSTRFRGIRVGISSGWRNLLLTYPVVRKEQITRMRKRTPAECLKLSQAASAPVEFRKIFPRSHQVYHYLALIDGLTAAVEADVTPISEEFLRPLLDIDLRKQQELLHRLSIPDDAVLYGVNVGAEYGPAKRWSLEAFAEVIRRFSSQFEAERSPHWVLFGGKGDVPATQALEKQLAKDTVELHNVAGKTNLEELALLAGSCVAFLTNDTGPMHVAAAAGAIVIVPFMSTSPDLTSAGSPLDISTADRPASTAKKHFFLRPEGCPCAPCFLKRCPLEKQHCLNGVSVDRVLRCLSEIR